jgi:PadR family transcriptional regulator
MITQKEGLKPEPLGHFEQVVLTAIVSLGGESYGVPIYDKVCDLAERRINLGSLYITLDRMEEKGLLASRLSDPAKEPRGRPKRFYRLQPDGFAALEESLANAKRLSEIFDDNSGSIRRWITKRKTRLVRQDT